MYVLYMFLINTMDKKFRKNASTTQLEKAQKLGVTQVTIAHYEKGQRNPDFDKVPLIAKILDVSIEELFRLKPNTPKNNTKSKFHGN